MDQESAVPGVRAEAIFNEVPVVRIDNAPAKFGAFSQASEVDIIAARAAERRVFGEIERLGLQRHAWELDTRGWTVIEPEKVGSPDFIRYLRDRVIAVNERVHGVTIDLEKGLSDPSRIMSFGEGVSVEGILYEDPAFEQAIANEAAIALISYLLGESCLISSVGGIIKNQGSQHMEMHVDAVGMPSPLPNIPVVANATWLLTDYAANMVPPVLSMAVTIFAVRRHHPRPSICRCSSPSRLRPDRSSFGVPMSGTARCRAPRRAFASDCSASTVAGICTRERPIPRSASRPKCWHATVRASVA